MPPRRTVIVGTTVLVFGTAGCLGDEPPGYGNSDGYGRDPYGSSTA